MARLITYSLLAFALSGFAIASPLILPRQVFGPDPTITSVITTPTPATIATLAPVPAFTFTTEFFALAAPSAAPTNVAPGTVTAGCGAFHTVAPGETCLLLEEEFNITDALFHTLNPEVNSACTNLIAGEAYCIQANATVVTPPPPVSVPPPSNIAPGTITTGCAQYFTVQSGQTCDIIDTMFNTTLPVFLLLNPEVNSGCTNLIAGLAYCVQST